MQTALKRHVLTAADYLSDEERSPIKHEYTGGAVFAMAGASVEHNQIALNIATSLKAHLKGKPCRVFMSDVKVRIDLGEDERFYYPDVMVGCDPRDKNRLYLEFPKLLVEVSSHSTERLDWQEKRLAYQNIESLEEYLIVVQDRPEATIFRRSNHWQPAEYNGLESAMAFQSIAYDLPMTSVYDGIFSA